LTIDDAFEIDAPLERTWPVLMDIPRVAGCIPNAEVNVSYKALVTVADIDHTTHSATFNVQGDELKGRGGVRATVTTSATAEDGKTNVTMHTEAHISGVVATVGGRLIESVARKTIAEFAKRLTALV
jgi:carbon monoxide dehydrogenase subunit G